MAFFASPNTAPFGNPSPASRAPANLSGLFRLVDDFDNYSKTQGQQRSGAGNAHPQAQPGTHPQQRAVVPTFTPRFDVRETEDAFELHGELPGADKDNVHVEFTDAQTIVVSGKVERAAGSSNSSPDTHDNGDDDAASITSSRNSFQPTVEDDVEDETGGTPTPATSTNVANKKLAATIITRPQLKYWVLERSVGEFRRAFDLPARVDPDGVRASLVNGILAVTVPKAKKHESRRIAIN